MAPTGSKPSGSEDVLARLDNWRRRAGRVNAAAAQAILEDPRLNGVLANVFSHAPYLSRICIEHPDTVIEALTGGTDKVLARVTSDLRALERVTGPAPALSRAVSPLKERATVAIGLGDLSGALTTREVGAALAELAEVVLQTGLDWLVRLAFRHGELILEEEGAPSPLPGFFILAGKTFSSGEPNYCGPLDVMFVLDRDRLAASGIKLADRAFERIAADLTDAFGGLKDAPQIFRLRHARRLNQRMRHLVLTTADALEELNENRCPTDRAWLAAARPVAGDVDCARDFLEAANAGIFADDLSVEQIGESVSPKRLPTEPDPTGSTALAQSLVRISDVCRLALGGYNEVLRTGSVEEVFAEAGRLGALDAFSVERLSGLMRLSLRATNRLQLIRGHGGDEDPSLDELIAQAALCGYTERYLFTNVVDGARAETRQIWLNLMQPGTAPAPAQSDAEANAATGALERIGFLDASSVGTTVDGWLKKRAREAGLKVPQRLSEVAPGLLTEIGRTRDPDGAVTRIDRLMAHLPPTIDALIKLRENEEMIRLFADLFGNTPEIGDLVAESPALIAELLDPQAPLPSDAAAWLQRFAPPLPGTSMVELRPRLADWLWENRARVGLGVLRREVPLVDAGPLLSALYDAALRAVYETVAAEQRAVGGEPGKGFAVIAMGRYGGRLMVHRAPIALTYVFDPDGEDGPTAQALHYYAELAHRVTRALGEPVEDDPRGALFEVDTSLRPGGQAGEVATSLRVFRNFYVGEVGAMDLLRLASARVVCGPAVLAQRVRGAISDLITRPRKAQRVLHDADRTRQHYNRPESIESLGGIATMAGGLEDVEMIEQALRLSHGAEHPYILSTEPLDAFDAMARAKTLGPDAAQELTETLRFYLQLATMTALTGDIDLRRAPPAGRLAELLAGAAGVADFRAVGPLAKGYGDRVMALYREIILGHEQAPDLRAPNVA